MTIAPRRSLLAAIRAVHTAVFAVNLGAILWLVVSGFLGRRDRSVAAATAIISVEIAVFLTNSGVCPLTPLAERYGALRGSVSDIYLPDRMARTLPVWSTALLVLAVALHARGVRRARATGL